MGMIDCPGWLAINATRYAMGRMTYTVQDTCEFLIHNLHRFDKGVRRVILDDIRDEINLAERRGTTLGMAMDHAQWKKVLKHFAEDSDD